MNDQKEFPLNRLSSRGDNLTKIRHHSSRRILVISSLKGAGKSYVCYNLAHVYTATGKRVLLIDFDLKKHISGKVRKFPADESAGLEKEFNPTSLSEAIVSLGQNLNFLPLSLLYGENFNSRDFSARNCDRILNELETDYEYLIIDTQTGLNELNVSLLMSSDQCLVISTADSSAISDTYSFVKAALPYLSQIPTGIIINRIREQSVGEEVRQKLNFALHQFLNSPIELLGMIPSDDAQIREEENFSFDTCHLSKTNGRHQLAWLAERINRSEISRSIPHKSRSKKAVDF